MLFDTHAHLADPGLIEELDGVLARAREAGVEWILTASSSLEDSQRNIEIVANRENIVAALGVHPELAGKVSPDWEAKLEELVVKAKPVAIGECGLDAHHPDPPLAVQMPVFRAQVRLAKKHKLPLVIHSRKAAEQALGILEEEGAIGIGGVFHCIEADEMFARAAVNAGFHIGVGGTVTFKRNDVLRNMLKRMPPEKVLLETDCPYLAPEPVRGKHNEPAFLIHTAEVVAVAMGMSVAALVQATADNARRLFKIREARSGLAR